MERGYPKISNNEVIEAMRRQGWDEYIQRPEASIMTNHVKLKKPAPVETAHKAAPGEQPSLGGKKLLGQDLGAKPPPKS